MKRILELLVAGLMSALLFGVAHGQDIYSTHGDGTRLGTIDVVTGAGTDVGPFGTRQTWAAAFDPDGTLYTIFNGFTGPGATLASVDPLTGAITPIGSVGRNMISLEVSCDGTMYGVGYNDRVLYEIDKATGNATPVGLTGISFTMDLAFDSDGTLWSTVGNNLWMLDTTTGVPTFVASFSGILGGSVMGIMFDDNDTLYATAYVPNSPLYQIDIGTGAATPIGDTGFFFPHGGDFQTNCVIYVDIDIKPGSYPNSINPRSKGKIPVAILATDEFDPWDIDPSTIVFGPDGAGAAHSSPHAEDVDSDGDVDLVFHFNTQETGIACGDTEATLTGETFDGTPIEGTDSVNTTGCK